MTQSRIEPFSRQQTNVPPAVIRLFSLARVFGLMLMVYSVTYFLPILTALIYEDGTLLLFIEDMLLTFGAGGLLWTGRQRLCARVEIQGRFFAGGAGMDRHGGFFDVPPDVLHPRSVLHRRLLRIHVRAHHHRGQRVGGSGQPAPRHQSVAA